MPHFVSKSGIKIPLFIVARASDQLEREAEAKLTFSMNKPIINLASLYNGKCLFQFMFNCFLWI